MKTVTIDDFSDILSAMVHNRSNIRRLATELQNLIGNYKIDSSNLELMELIEDFGHDLAYYGTMLAFPTSSEFIRHKRIEKAGKGIAIRNPERN